jgi:hypothetical protein
MRGAICSLALVCALAACGCGHLEVVSTVPRPNVVVAPDKAPSGQILGPAVPDAFVIPGTGSVNPVPVSGWRATLETGFRNAFVRPGPSGRQLEIDLAELSFSPAAVSGQFGTVAVVAAIRFQARLLDQTGAEIAALAGTVYAREANGSPDTAGMTDNAKKAVESLYEMLTAELLAKY